MNHYAGPQLSHAEMMVMTVSDIVNQLIVAHEQGADVNLNRLKSLTAQNYGLSSQPRLVDIIAAVPTTHKKVNIGFEVSNHLFHIIFCYLHKKPPNITRPQTATSS